ncbi:MAG: esterase-like activity of phytase family protein [Gemmataceae bacterium]
MPLLLPLTLLLSAPPAPTTPSIDFLGLGTLPGTTTDRSGKTDTLPDGTPHNRLGGMGSGIDYSGTANRYWLISDRGPKDGAVPFHARMHAMDIVVDPASKTPVTISLVQTVLFSRAGSPYSGALAAPAAERLDGEGIRLLPGGTVAIADEYQPQVLEFGMDGVWKRTWTLPAKFHPEKLGAKPEDELPPKNRRGRQPNRGIEGLARTPDGQTLVAMLQSPLIQDGGVDAMNKRVGHNIRGVRIDTKTGAMTEFVYMLAAPANGVSEILAINSNEFLVLERDGLGGAEAKTKKIWHIDLSGTTDVSDSERLPELGVPRGIVAARKTLWIDFLDERWGVPRAQIPEKFEGLSWGPDFADGRRLLLVTADNDFIAEQPFRVYAFAIGKK